MPEMGDTKVFLVVGRVVLAADRRCTPTDGHSWMPSTGILPAHSVRYWPTSTHLCAKSMGRTY